MIVLLLATALYVGNNACARCHTDIFKTYRDTPMARSSGIVTGGLTPGMFQHAASGSSYRIDTSGSVKITTARQSAEKKLAYFIGSGAAGQSYLCSRDGFLFQAPVTWYAQQSRWDVSPGYETDHASRWSRPIAFDCLNCHSSQVRSAAGFSNRYAEPPFAQPGVGCERCHGPGSEHVEGRAKMVNPVKLDAARRDSVCAQCHMSGEARETRAGRRFENYRPGALLTDYAAYFVYEGAPALKATGYIEKLAASRCKLDSDTRMWCGTCHDPHRVPPAAERVSWYRTSCLGCHQPAECKRGNDCVSCHMPKGHVEGGGHGVLTDHSIPRIPPKTAKEARNVWKLRPFSPADAGKRELGLAYAEVAARTGDTRQVQEALRLLTDVHGDAQVELRLADLYQRTGNPQRALLLYRSVLQKDPGSEAALVNLGNLYAAVNDLDDAVLLWREAIRREPCQPEAARNLQTAYRARGQNKEISAVLASQTGCVIK
jgi:tetratricopeptide (TPR) repeat protein